MFEALFGITVETPVILLVALVAALMLFGLILWSAKRHADPVLHFECGDPVRELVPSLAGLSHGSVIGGNSVELFENGAFFDALLDEIARATRSVHFETFLWKEGALSERLCDALIERRRAGLQVRVLCDADGCKKMGERAQQRLRAAGCALVLYHRKTLRNIGRVNRRDHRKVAVIDGKVALLGGHCIVDSWLGDADDKEHFRDIGLRLRGPAVHAVQSSFSENWIDETGELFLGDDVFPPLAPAGDVEVHVARVKPEGSVPAVKLLHHLAICVARERIRIQNPYFLPDREAIGALGRAVQRGVDVRIMVPSAEASDFPVVQHAAHRNFEPLLRSGVRIFEYPKTLLHQKVMTIDGIWSAVGSSNFDDRSFEINDEITLGLHDAAVAAALEQIFERDARECVELDHASWCRRGAWHKLKDNALYLFNEQL